MLGALGKAEDLLSGQETLNEGPKALSRECESSTLVWGIGDKIFWGMMGT